MKNLLSLLLLAMFSGLSAQTIFNTLYNEVANAASKAESSYNNFSQNAQNWTQTASNDLTNYTTASGQTFNQFAKDVQLEMSKSAAELSNELNAALNDLNEVSKLECSSYTESARNAMANMQSPLDGFSSSVEQFGATPEEVALYKNSVAQCKECISYATQQFICDIPQILEGNLALMRRLDDIMKNDPDVKNLNVSYKPIAAMVKMTYSDFSQSFLVTFDLLEKYRKALNIRLTPNSLQVLYGKEACQMYGSEAMGQLQAKLTSENPTTTIQKTTNRILTVLDKMSTVNDVTGKITTVLDAAKKYSRSQVSSVESKVVESLPPAPMSSAGVDLVRYGFDLNDRVVASNNGYLFIIKPNGYVYLYDHMVGRLPVWENGTRIETGWHIYKEVFAGTDRTIYGIENNGDLYWAKNTNSRDASAWKGRARIGTGWQGFLDVRAGNNGLIYARKSNGELVWYKNMQEGVESWHPKSGSVIGTGWRDDAVKHWMVGQDGVIFLVKPDGNLYWYLNTVPGEPEWSNNGEGLLIDTGWGKYVKVFGGKDNVIYGVTANGEIHRKRFGGKSPTEVPVYIQGKLSQLFFSTDYSNTSANTKVVQWKKTGVETQKFVLEKTNDGAFKIRNQSSGLYLGFPESPMENGAELRLMPSGQYHEFSFLPAQDGHYYIQAKQSGKYLCWYDDSRNPGAKAIQWDLTYPPGAQFILRYF